MSTKRPRRGRDFFVGGSITGSVIGDDNSDINITIAPDVESDSASLDELREAIALLRVQFAAEDSRVRYELQTIQDELGEDEPDGGMIRSRWKQVLKLLGPLKDLTTVAQTTTAILALFGGK
ncbi:MAG: hypothetical protein JO115_10170 [Pseudonocardiales bacterium]|nr:hypothetical protein [Pseudonocardiales bacterium]